MTEADSTKTLNGVSLAGAPTAPAKEIHMSKLSRRSLVASAASLPALAAPAVASASPSDADVELKQLGVRLLKANRDFDAVFAKPHFPDKEVDDAMGRIATLMPPIFSLTATTRDGLAVQAAAAASACRELWDDAGDWSTVEHPSWKVERPFLEAVCRYTGVAHPIVPDQPEKTPWLVHSAEPGVCERIIRPAASDCPCAQRLLWMRRPALYRITCNNDYIGVSFSTLARVGSSTRSRALLISRDSARLWGACTIIR
jgi:hypothetical protein